MKKKQYLLHYVRLYTVYIYQMSQINVIEYRTANWKTIQRNWQHRAHKTSKNNTKNTIVVGHQYTQTIANNTCTLLQTRHVPSYKHDMYPPTNKTCSPLQTRHVPSYKTWHVPSYKQDMYPNTNRTSFLCGNHHEHHNTELRTQRHLLSTKQ